MPLHKEHSRSITVEPPALAPLANEAEALAVVGLQKLQIDYKCQVALRTVGANLYALLQHVAYGLITLWNEALDTTLWHG